MNWPSFFLGVWGGIILSSITFCAWYIFILPKPLPRHIIYRKGQLPEIMQ